MSSLPNPIALNLPQTEKEHCVKNKLGIVWPLDFGNVPATPYEPNPVNSPGTTVGNYAEIVIPQILPPRVFGFNQLQGLIVSWMAVNPTAYNALGITINSLPEILLAPINNSSSGVLYAQIPVEQYTTSLSARVRLYSATLPQATPGPLTLMFTNYPVQPFFTAGNFQL